MDRFEQTDFYRELRNCLKREIYKVDNLEAFINDLKINIQALDDHLIEEKQERKRRPTLEEIRSIREWDAEKAKSEANLKKLEKFKRFLIDLRPSLISENEYLLNSPHVEYYFERDLVIDLGGKHALKSNVVPFPDQYKNMLTILDITIEIAEIARNNFHRRKAGRPSNDTYEELIKEIFVMSECLLEIKTVRTNNANAFNEIVHFCLSLILSDQKVDDNFPRLIKHCFESYSTVYGMAFSYKKYGRLDLYIEHVRRTKFCSDIAETFECDWAKWEKPYNFQLLISDNN